MKTKINLPGVTAQLLRAQQNLSVEEFRALIIAQKTASGTATADTLSENLGNNITTNDALFGADSCAASMVRSFRSVNKGNVQTRLDVMPVDDNGAGTEAAWTIVVGGTATADGTFTVTITGDSDKAPYSFPVAFNNGDSNTVVGAAIDAALAAEAKLPVSVANATGTVTLTAKHKGTVGNAVGIKISTTALSGLTFVLTQTVVGSGDPVLTAALAALDGKRYQHIILPSGWDVDALGLKNFIDDRFNVDDGVNDGRLFQYKTDTFSNLLAYGNSENSQGVITWGFNKVSESAYIGPDDFVLDYARCAKYVGVLSLLMTPEAAVAEFLLSTVDDPVLDPIGGIHHASLPFHNTLIPNESGPEKDGFSANEIIQLNNAGISVAGLNRAENAVILGAVVTMNKTDNAGNPDETYKYYNGVLTDSIVRETMVNNLRAKWGKRRLSRSRTPGLVRGDVIEIRQTLVDALLIEPGKKAFELFEENLDVSIADFAAGKIRVFFKYRRVGQVRDFDLTIQPIITV